jgi:2-(1,2-epoxy-1,2-dihydrophenyl)acetyl-CoA isomerase
VTEKLIDAGMALLELEDNGIARLTLNRPDDANGMSVPFLRALYDALMRCHGEPRLRVLIIRGAGPHFCAGGDVKDFASKGEALPDYLREATAWLQIAVGALMRLNAPVVASVHGFAAGGGGFGLACAADLVIAAESAKFLTGATRAGMAPDAGVSVTLPRLVGLRRAMELVLTNPILSAAEAKEIGLVNSVVADDELIAQTEKLAAKLAAGAPLALSQSKRLLWDGVGRSVESALPDEARTVSELSGTADAREGLAAVIERRRPEFTGR